MPHPVQFMGLIINFSRKLIEVHAKKNKYKLYFGGILISLVVIFLSGFSGWYLERLFLIYKTKNPFLSTFIFTFILSSSLASRSLNKSVIEIINLFSTQNEIDIIRTARKKLSFIVGRDVENLNKNEILRATAETASENSVDGIFAPLFWIFVGTILWKLNQGMPGPLAMAWVFKASSTIDSMLGYKDGDLKWLGFSGAKLDDLLTWIPSRIVLVTLPFCCKPTESRLNTIKYAWKDGLLDSSPNSGISEAIFAHCARVRMGGTNFYKGKKNIKPLIAKSYPIANEGSVKRILDLIIKLQFFWLLSMILIIELINL